MQYKTTTNIFLVCLLLQIIQSLFPHFINFQALQLSDLIQLHTIPRFLMAILMHMFSHAGWNHMWSNFSIGLPCMLYMEHKLGSKMLSFYVIMGLGALGIALLMPIPMDSLIGSSGAIFGCLAASCLAYPNRKLGMLVLFLWLVPELMALSISLLGGNVSHSAHLGGALAAIMYYHILGLPRKSNDSRRHHKAMRRV
jgi:membrane associated rhomboid family serine protease